MTRRKPMTEAEWLASRSPRRMLAGLPDTVSGRKLRLFSCACCRAVWHLLTDERGRRAVEVGERFADRQATDPERSAANRAASQWADECADRTVPVATTWATARERTSAMCWFAAEICSHNTRCAARGGALVRLHVNCLRCIFGNPFRAVPIHPAWRTPDVLALAASAYEERGLPAGTLDGARLAVLADALEEAGCSEADLLAHLRSMGPHVRGCWPVDLVLEKE
jgi:hypothetical protein